MKNRISGAIKKSVENFNNLLNDQKLRQTIEEIVTANEKVVFKLPKEVN